MHGHPLDPYLLTHMRIKHVGSGGELDLLSSVAVVLNRWNGREYHGRQVLMAQILDFTFHLHSSVLEPCSHLK